MLPVNSIETAAQYIREGKLVAFPTETVYGLGANALNPIAVAKVFDLKERPSFDPLIVHIASLDTIYELADGINDEIIALVKNFWPGPLSIILKKKAIVPDIVTAGLQTVGIRMPGNTIALELIRQSGCPIAAPSANKFGKISPTTAAHVRKRLPEVDYILDGGRSELGIESTIITFTNKGFIILRNGIITKQEIERYIPFDETKIQKGIIAPGMLQSHYSPTKPMLIADNEHILSINKSKAGLLSYSGALEAGYNKVIRLTINSDLKEYAVGLFEAMHTLEDSDVEVIVAEPVPETGIGIAIMDRLRKAANTCNL